MNRSFKYNWYIFLLTVICFLQVDFCSQSYAQDLNKEVYVIRPYLPVLTEATKISVLPEIEEITTATPKFSYSITPKRVSTSFALNPINPAKMVAVSLPKIYNSWLKLGLGNYVTPLVEFNISNLRSRDFAYGAYLYHKSSHSNITLENQDKVAGGYANNEVNMYGKRFYNKATLSGNLCFEQHGFNYYGYNTALFATDPLPEMERDSIRQRTYLIGFNADLKSTHTNIRDMNYKGTFGFDYFFDRDRNKEAILTMQAEANKYFGELQGGVKVKVDYFNLTAELDSSSNSIVAFNPWIGKNTSDWRFVLGFNAVYDIADISRIYFYPDAKLEITIVQNVLVPFMGLSGNLQANNYQQLATENEYITPGLRLKNSSNNLLAYAGIKGSISNAIRFRFNVSYAVNKDMHFFVNDTLTELHNQFTAEYDDVDLVTYHGQVTVLPASSLSFSLEGSYYDYNMLYLDKPWHKPEYELDLMVSYNLNEKINFNGEMAVLGTRWVKNKDLPEGSQELKPVADLNLKVNYQYSKLLTIFFDMYNITNKTHLIWNQFPSQQFNFLAGFSYKL